MVSKRTRHGRVIMTTFTIETIRQDFPILTKKIHGQPLVYLDNAATTQKPQVVIDTIANYYQNTNANVHRGVHSLSEQATVLYENSRKTVQQFINAVSDKEIIFTKGATESINLLAATMPLSAGDEVLITQMEHHSNIVPWQLACQRSGATLNVAPINDRGELLVDEYKKLLSDKTKIVGLSFISNAIGTINPVKQLTQLAHDVDAVVLLDATQAVAHSKIDVQDINCDFLAVSAHKAYGPTGVGALYGKQALLNELPPYQSGGDMIREVTFEKSTYAPLPAKFEAGTPNIAGVIGFAAALDYITAIGIDNIIHYEQHLLTYAIKKANQFEDIRLIGTAANKASILSFTMKDIHPHDIGTILDQQGIAIRTGHHCAMPIMQHFKIPATARASFCFYNTTQEIDTLFNGLTKIRELFHG